jgi:hypothetical protein
MDGEACGDRGAILNSGSLVLDSVTVPANLGERGGPGRDRARFDRAFDRVAGLEPWASRKLGKLERKTT